ncbi:MAG: xanthine dehydrogenase family protein molybdopterin-binding subunit [Betaproteobacteria bacterium]|nr:xanthine dehydrogenase family protein molybdopterin-binding subunit [Betaproteobacteria bacterium]
MQKFGYKGRLEDARMLTGRGRYVADWNLPGQAYGSFMRSDRPHARIVSIDASAALAMPGVISVLTGDDTVAAGYKSLPAFAPMKGRNGMDLIIPHRPTLALGRVRHVGEPIALVVADSALHAQDAAEAIVVDYEELPAVFDAKDAIAPGAPLLHDNVPGNQALDFVGGDEAATEAAFRAAARVVRLDAYHTRVVGNPMEPRTCIGSYDAATGMYYLHACTQGASVMRGQISAVLGVPPERIRIVAEEVGGGFGVRFNLYPEYCAALLAAKKLGRPVKWVGTRSEVFLADEQARDVLHRSEMALDANGRILGMRFDFACNLGAYLAPTGAFVNTLNLVNVISGVYDVQAVYVHASLAFTNTIPTAAYRAAGRPVSSYAIERLVDHAARQIGMDPAEFRRRNMVPTAKFPYKIVSGFEYDCGDFVGVLDDAVKAAEWTGFEKRRAQTKARGRLRGRGMASYIEASGGGGMAPHDEVKVRWGANAAITLEATSHSHGQGHETVFAQIVAGVLGVPMESIRLRTADPDQHLVGNPTGGSRSLLGVGSVLQLAAREVVKKGMELASEELEAAVADIEFGEGDYRVTGTDRRVSIVDLAKKHAGTQPHPLDTDFATRFGSTFPNGCHIAEVEVEPETGEIEIVAYISCDDAGNIINHQLVEGQMQGGITQGAGHILGEQAIYDRETGQLLTGSFMDYPMPRAILVDGLRVLHHPVPTKTNPLGAKGVGEAGVTGSMPCLMNAIIDALGQAGVTHFDMPATQARVWEALQAAKAGKPASHAVTFA